MSSMPWLDKEIFIHISSPIALLLVTTAVDRILLLGRLQLHVASFVIRGRVGRKLLREWNHARLGRLESSGVVGASSLG